MYKPRDEPNCDTSEYASLKYIKSSDLGRMVELHTRLIDGNVEDELFSNTRAIRVRGQSKKRCDLALERTSLYC